MTRSKASPLTFNPIAQKPRMHETKYLRIACAIGMEHSPRALRIEVSIRPYRWSPGPAKSKAQSRLFESRLTLLGMRMRGAYHQGRSRPGLR